jgi:carbon monoxide dehydrogenase subunit G
MDMRGKYLIAAPRETVSIALNAAQVARACIGRVLEISDNDLTNRETAGGT